MIPPFMLPPRRKTRITYEGLTFLLILSFIVLGSILRQINLLVLLSGLMIGPVFFNWRISRKMLERVRFTRRIPERIHAGTRFVVHWEARNSNPRMPLWNARVDDLVRRSGDAPGEGTHCGTVLEQANAQTTGTAAYECLIARRGIYEFGPARAGTAFPLGLVSTVVDMPELQSCIVAPRPIPLSRELLSRIRSRKRTTRETGDRRRGFSQEEFFSLRGWQTGDNRRFVHWRSSAKRDELLVRQGVEPDSFQTLMIFDFGVFEDASDRAQTATETLAGVATWLVCECAGWRQESIPAIRIAAPVAGKADLADAAGSLSGPIQLRPLLARLAVVQSGVQTGVFDIVRSALAEWGNACRIFVFSTRSFESAQAAEPLAPGRDVPAHRLEWVNVATDPALVAAARIAESPVEEVSTRRTERAPVAT